MRESLSGNIPCKPFSAFEVAHLRSRFDPADIQRSCIYDIRLSGGIQACQQTKAVEKGVVKLVSRNLGTEFLLVNVGTGRGLFGFPRTEVEIYFRRSVNSRYWPLCTVSNLVKALRTIDRIYNEAADGYLP